MKAARSRALEVAGEPQSRNKLEEAVKGKRDYANNTINVGPAVFPGSAVIA